MTYKGTVFLPVYLERGNHPAELHSCFAEGLRDRFHLNYVVGPALCKNDIKGDILITIKCPQFAFPKIVDVKEIPSNIYHIAYISDMHGGDKYFKEKQKEIFDRANLIITKYDSTFRNRFPGYVSKMRWVPSFIAPAEYYSSLPWNWNEKLNKCLITGSLAKDFYPIRNIYGCYALESKDERFEVLRHPGYAKVSANSNAIVGKNYADLLHKYRICFSSTSVLDYLVVKTFEIMATGSLLLSNWGSDMDLLGMKDKMHFIQIDDNIDKTLGIMDDVFQHPKDYEDIARNGKELTFENHTLESALDTIETILLVEGVL